MDSTKHRIRRQQTVTHGDTHGDNIFFDPQSLDIWIIDFARTAERANIFDLALIESEFKFSFLPDLIDLSSEAAQDDFWLTIQESETVLASQEVYEKLVLPTLGDSTGLREHTVRSLRTIGKLVVDVRQLACQQLGRSGPFDDYKLVLLVLAFKYMKLASASSERRAIAYLSALSLVRSFTSLGDAG